MGVPKNRGTPKMDGENNGQPLFKMDDLGGYHYFRKHPYVFLFVPAGDFFST